MLLNPKILTKIECCRAKFSHGHKLGSAWSCLVLVGNDQKIDFQTQGVSATGDWASALWVQEQSESAFFGTPFIWFLGESCVEYYKRLWKGREVILNSRWNAPMLKLDLCCILTLSQTYLVRSPPYCASFCSTNRTYTVLQYRIIVCFFATHFL